MRRPLTIVYLIVTALAVVPAARQPQSIVQNTGATPLGGLLEFGGGDRWVAQLDGMRVHVYEVASGMLIRTLGTQGLGVAGFATHPAEDVVFMGDASNRVVTAWDVRTGAARWRNTLPIPVSSGQFSFSSASLHLDAKTNVLTMLRVDYGGAARADQTPKGRSSDDPTLAAMLPPATVVRLDAATGGLRGSPNRVANPSMVGGPGDDRWYVGARLSGQTVQYQVYEIGSERPIGPPQTRMPLVRSGSGRAVLFDYMSMMAKEPQVDLIEVGSGKSLGRWEGVPGFFSADGSKLVVAAPSASMFPPSTDLYKTYKELENRLPAWRIIDVLSGNALAEAPAGTTVTIGWALSRDGQRIASVRDGRLETMVVAPAPSTTATAVVPSTASTTATASAEPPASTGDAPPPNVQMAEAAGAFTDDGRWFVTRALDGQFDVFDMATGTRVPFRLPAQTTMQKTVRVSGPFRIQANAGPAGAGLLWQPVVLSSGDLPLGADLCMDRILDWTRLRTAPSDLVTGMCRSSPDQTKLVAPVRGSIRSGGVLGRLRDQVRGNGRDTLEWAVFDLTQHPKVRRLATLRPVAGATPAKDGTQFAVWSPDGRYIVVTSVAEAGGRSTFGAWNANTGEPVDSVMAGVQDASFVGFVPGADHLAARTDSEIRVVALSTLRTALRLPPPAVGALANFHALALGGSLGEAVNLANNDAVWVGPVGNDGLWIRQSGTGDVIGELRLAGNGEWLVTTPTGLFDGSPGGWQQLAWRTEDGRVLPGEVYFNEYYQPGLLADLLAGRVPRQVRPVVETDRRQPTVTLSAKISGPRTARVVVGVRQAPGDQETSGARDLRLFRNGVLVKTWRGDLGGEAKAFRQFTADVPLIAGTNRLVAYAFNRHNIKSTDAVAVVESGGKPRPPQVHLIAVGVDRYSNSAFNLRYAGADARTFAAEFERRQRALGAAQVNVVTLLDEEATRENVMFALARLSGTPVSAPAQLPAALAALTRANPEDTVAVYFAGHGLGVGERFHLIPTNLGYAGPRENADAALPTILAHAISDRDLEQVLEPLDARHIMLVIDACDSGLALQSDEPRFGPMNSRGLAQLAYEKGMVILTASQAYQAALEAQKLQHGYLTYALVEEGLKQFAADTFPKDGEVQSIEWAEFAASRVPQLQLEALHQAAEQKRVLKFQAGPSGAPAQLQTPRVFWRRDDAQRAFVVARP